MADPGPGSRSGLIVEIPEAEPAVARLGIPAHITVLFPFMPPREIGPAALTELEQLFAAVSQFRFRLGHTAWFGDEVLWLAPRDPEPFRALTRAVVQAFPAFPPYEGQFGDSTPHLTDLHAAETSVQAHLPIDAQATAATLVTQQSTGGRWTKTATFTLAGHQRPAYHEVSLEY